MSYVQGIYLVARREYLAYVSAWGFWLSLITTPLLLAVVMLAPLLLGQAEPVRYVTVIAEQAEARDAVRDAFKGDARYEFVLAPAPDIDSLKPYLSGEMRVGDAPLFAAFVVRGRGETLKLEYWSTNLTDDAPVNRARAALRQLMLREALAKYGLQIGEVERVQGLSPEFSQFDPRPAAAGAVTDRERAPFYIAIGLSVLLWSAIFGVANMLLTGVLEEKSNKILDALLTSVTPLQILIGKLCGVAGVSLTLFAVWGAAAYFGLTQLAASAPGEMAVSVAEAALDPMIVATFFICFVAGYLLYGALFLGLGALCESIQEAQSLLGPMFLVLAAPLLLLGPALVNPNAPIVTAASWVPFFTPFVMMMRAPAGLTPADAAGPVALLVISLIVVLFVAARVFRAGVSHQLKLADILRLKKGT
jgi:ABC-2 type transport system permease protein